MDWLRLLQVNRPTRVSCATKYVPGSLQETLLSFKSFLVLPRVSQPMMVFSRLLKRCSKKRERWRCSKKRWTKPLPLDQLLSFLFGSNLSTVRGSNSNFTQCQKQATENHNTISIDKPGVNVFSTSTLLSILRN